MCHHITTNSKGPISMAYYFSPLYFSSITPIQPHATNSELSEQEKRRVLEWERHAKIGTKRNEIYDLVFKMFDEES